MTFYVSTPIYYVNGAPHIGHAYTTMVADAMARYYRQAGHDVFFQTGTDEHGLKVQREAEKQGITPQQLADNNSSLFAKLFEELEITHDRFIRTTEEAHHKVVTEVVNRMKANDDIYLDRYAGWYASSDEAFYGEDEIEDGKAIATGANVEWVEEESYFFRLSKYQEPLLKYYKENPSALLPDVRRNEVIAFLEGGLRDLSISRTTFDWGIRFPGDEKHVLYVWVDALTNYITGVDAFQDNGRYDKFWPCDCHLIGKDILRFHAVYWPAFLLSAGLEPPKQIFAHGWWLNEGEKMSKSKGNFLDAFALAKDYPLDVLRYYLMREVPFGNDGNFVQARLIERNNSELADNVGNLVNRTLKMAQRFLSGACPAFEETSAEEDVAIRKQAVETRDAIAAHMEAREPHKALEVLMAFSGNLNQYVHHSQPWALNKQGNTERLKQVLYHALEGIRWVGVLGHAFLPNATSHLLKGLGAEDVVAAAALSTVDKFGGLQEGTTITPPDVLFHKLELPKEEGEEQEQEKEAKKSNKKDKGNKKEKEKKSEGEEAKAGVITYDRFMDVEIHVGLILTAENIKKSDKLLQLTVDVGEENPRPIVAGIALSFAPEDLVNQRIAVVTNLKPAKIFGRRSEGMLLAAETTDGKLELARYSEAVAPGTRIR
ncbi:MAG: methionine--tRNA ligase [Deltaproteobacteria bacterium]|nr:MAG: methionine--tRNA ligase [Deltaproteobacteria bacterium]